MDARLGDNTIKTECDQGHQDQYLEIVHREFLRGFRDQKNAGGGWIPAKVAGWNSG
ncbi:hypothetical protein FQZ97_710350 [compost metagenome]